MVTGNRPVAGHHRQHPPEPLLRARSTTASASRSRPWASAPHHRDRLSPVIAAAMALSSVTVVTNANRLRRWHHAPMPPAAAAGIEPQVETAAEAPDSADRAATVTDPVCGMRIETDTAAGKRSTGSATVYFCSAHCAAAFHPGPGSYGAAVAGHTTRDRIRVPAKLWPAAGPQPRGREEVRGGDMDRGKERATAILDVSGLYWASEQNVLPPCSSAARGCSRLTSTRCPRRRRSSSTRPAPRWPRHLGDRVRLPLLRAVGARPHLRPDGRAETLAAPPA